VAYVHGATAVANAYAGAVYSPTQNHIYLVPYDQGTVATWHYIDCSNGSVVSYTLRSYQVAQDPESYIGGSYSPTNNKIYLGAYAEGDATAWRIIVPLTAANVSPMFAASTLAGN
jgi:hypothetical protein